MLLLLLLLLLRSSLLLHLLLLLVLLLLVLLRHLLLLLLCGVWLLVQLLLMDHGHRNLCRRWRAAPQTASVHCCRQCG